MANGVQMRRCIAAVSGLAMTLTVACTAPEPEAPPSPTSAEWLYAPVLTDLRLGEHPGFERVVLEFQSDGASRSWKGSTIRACNRACDMLVETSSNPMAIAGSAYFTVVTGQGAGCTALDVETLQPVHGVSTATNLAGTGLVREVSLYDCFEGYVGVAIGITHAAPIHVQYLNNPQRLVLDLWTGKPGTTQTCQRIEAAPSDISCSTWPGDDSDPFLSVTAS